MKKTLPIFLLAAVAIVLGCQPPAPNTPPPPPGPPGPSSVPTTAPDLVPGLEPDQTRLELPETPDFLLAGLVAQPTEKTTQDASGAKENNPIFGSSLEYLKDPVPVADAEAKTEAEMKLYLETIPGSKITFKMIPIKGGKFLMGSPDDEEGRLEDEGPQHEVEIKPFWMEEHEVTWKEFEQFGMKILQESRKNNSDLAPRQRDADAFAKPTPAYDLGSISYDNAGKEGYPAGGMTLYTAQAYCKWLTMVTGRYYRLPTEAEWEYACRAGTDTPYFFGEDDSDLEEYAWYADNSEDIAQKVKQKKPNPWGLYDMHGNMSEWVLEQYDVKTYANRKPGTFGAPVKPAKGEGFGQVARGGNCESTETADLRSARRLYSIDAWKAQDPQYPQSIWWATDASFVGFRVVRPLEPPKTEAEAKVYEPDPTVWLEYSELNQRD